MTTHNTNSMDTNKKKDKKDKKDKEVAESLHPERHKGPQKPEHTNQYGDQDKEANTQ